MVIAADSRLRNTFYAEQTPTAKKSDRPASEDFYKERVSAEGSLSAKLRRVLEKHAAELVAKGAESTPGAAMQELMTDREYAAMVFLAGYPVAKQHTPAEALAIWSRQYANQPEVLATIRKACGLAVLV